MNRYNSCELRFDYLIEATCRCMDLPSVLTQEANSSHFFLANSSNRKYYLLDQKKETFYDDNVQKGIHYNSNEAGNLFFTEYYHLKKGCLNCPYGYKRSKPS